MEDKLREQRKQMIIDLINDPLYVPMKEKELAAILQVPKNMRWELHDILEDLLSEGKISVSAKRKFGKPDYATVIGTFTANPRGFGFVTVEGMHEDVYIPPEYIKNALHGDKVQIMILPVEYGGKRREGRIVRVIEHGLKEVVGTFKKNRTFGFVIPDNQKITRDIFVPLEHSKGAENDTKVVISITDYGTDKKKPEGRVKEILGSKNDPGTDILSVAKAYEIPMEFPPEVGRQLKKIPDKVTDIEGRMDIRDWQTVTIDGEDAKDLDDAITLIKKGDHYQLGVHIADVSHYVTEDSALDKEAVKRGTSVYLIDRVIPMLPKKLSNGICSLNEGCDRLTLSCIMDIDEKGNVIDHMIAETLIQVDRRMSYTSVKKILTDRDQEEMEKYQELIPMFERMQELSALLRKKRFGRGAIDFDFPESKIYLNEKGEPVDIKPYDQNVATKIIEDFMLLANETVAEDYYWQELPFVYRIHEKPDEDRMMKFGMFINNFGYSIHSSNGEIHPKELQKLLDKIEGTPTEPLISRLMLRSMKQAKYTTENTGHFGLSAKYYCHFTSPIRRYPDLQIHRIIKENMREGLSEKQIRHYKQILPEVSKRASSTERRAEEVEREVEKMKKAQYMSKRIGKAYTGVISGVTAYGMYVELDNTVEGMVHVSDLFDDYYQFIESQYALVGEVTGKTYKLGQSIRIKVQSVDMTMKTINFLLD